VSRSKEAKVFDGRYPARVSGPLAGHVSGFKESLVAEGFTPRTAQDNAYVLAHLSRWLEKEGLAASELTDIQIGRFVQARRAEGRRRWRTVRSMGRLVGYLRERRVIPLEGPRELGPVEQELMRFRLYLLRERRLAERTARQRVDVARRFLAAVVVEGRLRLELLDAAAVIAFISAESRRYARSSVKVTTTSVRSLLHYLFVAEIIDRDLTGAVPSVAGWRLSGLPKSADDDTVARLLASCDRSTAIGCRDYAVMMLMDRLGLRAAEIAALRLDDLDWRAGELVIHGKGGRVDRLPLPEDVGAALVNYLRRGRRASSLREVFLRSCGPDAPMSRQAVVMVTRNASARAGIATVGAHRLRHRAASRVLAGGGNLAEAAQLLRHHGEETTAIYAKVDQAALATVVQPWPGAGKR
jgi:integrase/recombinase XerD